MFADKCGQEKNRVSFEDSVDCPAANKRDRPADAKRGDGPFGSRRKSEKAKPERPVPPKKAVKSIDCLFWRNQSACNG